MLGRTILTMCLLVQVQSTPTWIGWPWTENRFPDQPTPADLFAELDMNHPNVLEQQAIEQELFPVKKIVEIVPGKVYQAIAYTMGYATVVITPEDTLILIDAPESYPHALEVVAAFRGIPAIGNKPFVAIIVTLFHGDHLWGMRAFSDDPNNTGEPIPLIWNSKSPIEAEKYDAYNAFKVPRLIRQIGLYVPDPWHLHDIVLHRVAFLPNTTGNVVQDLLFFNNDDHEITKTVAGMELRFIPVPGYTVDQMMVYIPSLGVLHIGDVYFYGFTNIYPMRGEPARDSRKWADSKYKVANYPDVDFCVSSHALPIYGGDTCATVMTHTADSMMYVHDQTLRHMMKGETADVIAPKIKLPAEQRTTERGYNREVYGILETSSKAVFDFYVGWFSGQAEDIYPPDRITKRYNMVRFFGASYLNWVADQLYNEGDYRSALEMATYVYKNDKTNRIAKELRTMCMLRLAESNLSVQNRHYFLTVVLEDWGFLPLYANSWRGLNALPLNSVFLNLQAHVDAEKLEADGVNTPVVLSLYLKLENANMLMILRNSILYYESVATIPAGAATFETTDAEFRAYLTGAGALTGTETNGANATTFFGYFDLLDQVPT